MNIITRSPNICVYKIKICRRSKSVRFKMKTFLHLLDAAIEILMVGNSMLRNEKKRRRKIRIEMLSTFLFSH